MTVALLSLLFFFALAILISLLFAVSGYFLAKRVQAAKEWGIHCAKEAFDKGLEDLEPSKAIQAIDGSKKFLGADAWRVPHCVEHYELARHELKMTQIFRREMEGLKEILEIVKQKEAKSKPPEEEK
jgi:hypothetical protein